MVRFIPCVISVVSAGINALLPADEPGAVPAASVIDGLVFPDGVPNTIVELRCAAIISEMKNPMTKYRHVSFKNLNEGFVLCFPNDLIFCSPFYGMIRNAEAMERSPVMSHGLLIVFPA